MARNLNHNDFLKMFSKPQTSSVPVQIPTGDGEQKENSENFDNYKKCNNSLVVKNNALKNEIANLHKKINELLDENQSQREKIALLESGTDEAKIDFLVAERFKKKMNHLNTLTEKTVQMLGRAAADYRAFFCDMSANVDSPPVPNLPLPPSLLSKPASMSRPQKMRAASINLMEKVPESPLVRSKRPAASPERAASPPSKVTMRRTPKVNVNPLAEGTPRARRTSAPSSTPARRLGTPGASDTVRQKRAAASRISSFAEPSLNSKLRRPGKFDEPSPFISTDFV